METITAALTQLMAETGAVSLVSVGEQGRQQ